MWPASNVATGAQRDARRTVNQGSAPGFDWLGETPSNGRKRRKRTPAENVARSFLGDFLGRLLRAIEAEVLAMSKCPF